LTWIVGVILLLLIVGFLFTGQLLPWDQRAYWGTVVGTEIMGTAPGLGAFIQHVIRGGPEIGPLTLTRFFALHILFLPAILVIGIMVHLYLMRRIGIAGPVGGAKDKGTRRQGDKEREGEEWLPFYPYQAVRDTTVIFVACIVLIFLAWHYPPMLEKVADPSDTSYTPRPPWYFLFLFQLLRYFEGPFEVVGAVILPTVGLCILLFLPFLDRRSERHPFRRPIASIAALTGVTSVLILTILGAKQPPLPAGGVSTTGHAVDQATAPGAPLTPVELAGKVYFREQNCIKCHSLNGKGGKIGPELAGVGVKRDAEWLNQHFRNPSAVVPGSVMPSFDLPVETLNALSAYLLRLNDPASSALQDRPVIEKGGQVFYETGCLQCHLILGAGMKGMAPDLSQVGSRREKGWIIDQITNPRTHNPGSIMPIYGEKLQGEEIGAVAEFLSNCR
jgi:ubiquinol-cytochrome c reductase cytochrome b subunit